MAFGLGSLNQIIQTFNDTITEIWGGSIGASNNKVNPDNFKAEYGGSLQLKPSNWIGNSKTPNVISYGFLSLDLKQINQGSINPAEAEQFFLQIPPQSIQQKEVFATNVTATRKGVIVESEGVVFKDIIIKGTTGVFPGVRGTASNPIPAKNITDAPRGAEGVDPQTGRSRKQGVKTISGYEEFLGLRQFFLKFAKEKVKSGGNRFMVFVNEKDSQSLIVEPLEFIMDRSAKSPMTYEYTIVLKAIGTLDQMFTSSVEEDNNSGLDFFSKVGNVAANVSARIQQARATINASRTLLERVSQAVDQTFIDPLRQIQFATEDLADGISTVLSLPAILYNNASQAILDTRDNLKQTDNAINNFSLETNRGSVSNSNPTSVQDFSSNRSTAAKINTDTRRVVQRSFVENLAAETDKLLNNLVDSFNINSEEYNQIVNHVQTIIPSPLKSITDEELLLLGALTEVKVSLDLLLGTNDAFESQPEEYFSKAEDQLKNIVAIPVPSEVREITIQQNDTLERIAQRELGNADRWLEIVVLNKLKAPYIDSARAEGVKAYGDKLLIGE